MGKASSSKKVSRVARTGGGRTSTRRTSGSWGFPLAMGIVVVLGVLGVYFSRDAAHHKASADQPTVNDHWHAAYGFDVCGTFLPDLPQPPNLIGLHTHNDGLIHVEPYVTGSALDRGANATLARFRDGEPGFKLTSTEVQVPGGKLMKNGDQCDGKPGKLTIRQWPDANADAHTDYTDPSKVKITDQGAITIAFLAEGATDIPKPASIANLSNPNAGEGASNMPTTPTS